VSGTEQAALLSMSTKRPARRKFPLQLTLMTWMIGLLVVTVAVIGTIVHVRTTTAIEWLVHLHLESVATATRSEVKSLLQSASNVVDEYATNGAKGRLPLDDPEALGMLFVERIRHQPVIGWIGFGDARDHSYTGATRAFDDGTIRYYRAAPARLGSKVDEFRVDVDSSRTRVHTKGQTTYKVQTKGWFKKGLKAARSQWFEPYQFTNGAYGMTVARRLVLESAPERPVGVLSVDFFLRDLDAFLAKLAAGESGRVVLVTEQGTVIGLHPEDGKLRQIITSGLAQKSEAEVSQHQGDNWQLPLEVHGVQYRAWFSHLVADGDLDWQIWIIVPEEELTGVVEEILQSTMALGLLGLLFAAMLAWFIARNIATPVKQMSEDMEQLGSMQLTDTEMPDSFIKEIHILGDSIQRMKAALRSFERYVPANLVRQLIRRGEVARLGGDVRELTIHFSDIAGFTGITEKLDADTTVRELGEYLELMTDAIDVQGGTIDKFMGDGILAFFNAPDLLQDHTIKACQAAIDAQAGLEGGIAEREHLGRPVFRARIGLALGPVLVGNIGTNARMDYTVIGDTANLAARLESLNKFYGTSIMVSDRLHSQVSDEFEWRRLDRAVVVGRRASTDLFELLGNKGAVDADLLEARDLYEKAMDAYLARSFADAQAGFEAARKARPGDKAAQVLAGRAATFVAEPPGEDWDGSWHHTKK
jgi:adenylate cyclase